MTLIDFPYKEFTSSYYAIAVMPTQRGLSIGSLDSYTHMEAAASVQMVSSCRHCVLTVFCPITYFNPTTARLRCIVTAFYISTRFSAG